MLEITKCEASIWCINWNKRSLLHRRKSSRFLEDPSENRIKRLIKLLTDVSRLGTE